jgi:two-component system cell cycle sensor histidine kinase/response regulator CckA
MSESSIARQESLLNYSFRGGLSVAGLGLFVLICWALHLPDLSKLGFGPVTMKVNTALCLLFIGAAISLQRSRSEKWRAWSGVLGALVLLLATLTLAEYLFGVDLRIDQGLFYDSGPYAGRMSPITALDLFFLGAGALYLGSGRKAGRVTWTGVFAVLAVAPATVAFLAQIFNAQFPFQPMAVPTALGVLVAAVSMGFVRPIQPIGQFILEDNAGGILIRRFMPAIWLTPPVLAWLILRGIDRGLFNSEFALAFYAAANLCILVVLSFVIAIRLNEVDGKRSQTEEALRSSQARFERLVSSGVLGVVVSNYDGKVLEANDAFLRMLGYTRQDFLDHGLSRKELNPPEGQAQSHEIVRRLHDHGTADAVEKEYLHKDGRRVPVLVGAAALDGQSNVGFVVDLTDQKGAQKSALREAEGRVRAESAMQKLEEQLRQAQKMEALGRLAGGVAHDFNNLLTILVGQAEMLLEDMAGQDASREGLELIRSTSERAAGLTQQLLMFSRQQVVEPKVVDLNQALVGLEKMLRRVLREDIDLSIKLSSTGRVRIDPGSFEQVVMNMTVNARDAMPQRGRFGIETADVDLGEGDEARHLLKPGAYLELTFSDTGIGMDEAVRAKIFEPFFTTKDKGRGTGLGLATVYGIVQQAGGDIWVYSELGKGSVFKIYLPRVGDPVETILAKPEPGPLEGTETILLLEDDDQVREVVLSILQRRGYAVLEARNAGEALLFSERHPQPIHLLLSDVIMPQMSGPELAERLLSARSEMKVLFMSGYSDISSLKAGLMAPGTAFIQKPVSSEKLSRKIRELLDVNP